MFALPSVLLVGPRLRFHFASQWCLIYFITSNQLRVKLKSYFITLFMLQRFFQIIKLDDRSRNIDWCYSDGIRKIIWKIFRKFDWTRHHHWGVILDSEKTLQRWMIIAFQQLKFLNWMNFIKRKEKSIMLKFDYFSFKIIGKTSIKLTKSNHLELLKSALR
jgi:hypothetical protein